MNKILFISLIILASCKNTQNTKILDFKLLPLAKVEMKQTDGKDAVFFSTVQGRMFILCDGRGGILMDSIFQGSNAGYRFNDLGVGNACFVNNHKGIELYTAKHVAEGLEEYIGNSKGDVAIINSGDLETIDKFIKDSHPKIYNLGVYESGDSIYVKGSLLRNRVVYDVTVSGTGEVFDFNNLKKVVPILNNGNEKFADGRSIWLRLEKNTDLGGLSGSPAFNQKGEVIGVFSGRNGTVYEKDTLWSVRIALLK